jgi:hypothetical protein
MLSLLLLLAAPSVFTRAQELGPPPQYVDEHGNRTDAARKEARLRHCWIVAEAARLGAGHPWAGQYENVGEVLALAPDGGFVSWWNTCAGAVAHEWGRVEERNGELVLHFELPAPRGRRSLGAGWIPVPWGERVYLVERYEDLCNAINAGVEPRDDGYGLVLLRARRTPGRAEGLPRLPPSYAALLLDQPLEARIVEVLGSPIRSPSSLRTRVRVDVGSSHGAWPAMQLHLENFWNPDMARLVDVGAQSSVAEIRTSETRPPQVGWVLSTREPQPSSSGRTSSK